MIKKILIIIVFVYSIAILQAHRSKIQYVSAYTNHCWNCKSDISSDYCSKCSDCGWYICKSCGECSRGCDRTDNDNWLSSLSIGQCLLILAGIGVVLFIVDKIPNK